MTTIPRHVLNMNSTVKKACDNYIDDIFVDESVETAENVAKYLEKFGLQCKPPEELEKGRKLIGHYPVAGSLRLQASYIKRLDGNIPWNEYVSEDCKEKMNELLHRSEKDSTRGISQLLVQRRLNTIKKIAKDIKNILQWIPSELNLADRLSRIPQKWGRTVCATGIIQQKDIWKVLLIGHFGVDRTLQLCLRNNQNVSRKEISAVIASCNQCNSIDPYSVKWKQGQLSVKQNWNRVALDVTHVGAELYLSMIDCGPSRYTVWRKLVTKTAAEIIGKLEEIFSSFGPPVCLLMDNEFRLHKLTRFADEWDVDFEYRAAHRAQGNGIVERIQRTIKRTVARSRCSIALAILLYNETISSNCIKSPSQRFKQKPTSFFPGVDTRKKVEKYEADNIFKEGDNVWVKPAQETKCNWSWIPGIVRKQNAWSFDVETANRVFPRHFSHLRRRIPDSDNKKDI
ncbi:uncharacterized protein LOC136080131 [Hydra vulgaris]|uniref:Uncharacterized protein LOC136080131 n=1 Tax=Hydra vulgaris TaxID=6087 RepID=A0ABM4BUH3_HYDVU